MKVMGKSFFFMGSFLGAHWEFLKSGQFGSAIQRRILGIPWEFLWDILWSSLECPLYCLENFHNTPFEVTKLLGSSLGVLR